MSRTSNRDRPPAGDSGEPELVTPPELQPVLDALRRREPIFHRPKFGSTRAEFERMAAADFWEIGASGRRYSRAHVLDVLEHRAPDPILKGRHLIELGVAPGPRMGAILREVYERQLDGRVTTLDEGIDTAREIIASPGAQTDSARRSERT